MRTETVTMPKRLTAENGAKSSFVGGGYEKAVVSNPNHCGCGKCDCCLNGLDEDEMIAFRVPVSWTTIKEIYDKAVEELGE